MDLWVIRTIATSVAQKGQAQMKCSAQNGVLIIVSNDIKTCNRNWMVSPASFYKTPEIH